MIIFKNKLTNFLLSQHRYTKKIICIFVDINLCILSVWLAYYLRLGEAVYISDIFFSSVLSAILLFLIIFNLNGVYNQIFRYSGSFDLGRMSNIFIIYGVLYFITILFLGSIPRTIGIIQPLLFYIFLMVTRIFISNLLLTSLPSSKLKENFVFLIENSNQQIPQLTLKNNKNYNLVGFVSDNLQLVGRRVMGHLVHSVEDLKLLIENKNVSHILIDLTNIRRQRKNELFKLITNFNIKIKSISNFDKNNFIDLNIIDLLGRTPVEPERDLLLKNVKNKVVAVTGAGGSIGSEITRQLLLHKPKHLLLIENNELALYQISEELNNDTIDSNSIITPVLLTITDKNGLEDLFKQHHIQTIYHAAAYKHVPIVEDNVVQASINNIIGTHYLSEVSIKFKVETFVLISSDKAVRPTNFMGATKRIAELILQTKSQSTLFTKFAIVRFGNVLGSSGSVVPLFKKQLDLGGPLLITHKDVIRYFMTPQEAAQLVIQAGSLSKKCEIFVLDMGKSVRIFDLAQKMIMLSGKTLKSISNPSGEIEIK